MHESKIKANKSSSTGVACIIPDYKTGRAVHLLSQGEKYYWYLLRWQDDVETIEEQYELDLKITQEICEELNIRHPRVKGQLKPFTSDLVVTKTDGSKEVYSVKNNRKMLDKDRTVEKLYVEKMYWNKLGIKFKLVFKDDVDMVVVNNIIDVTSAYKKENIFSIHDLIRHKIANKKLMVDLTKPIKYEEFIIEGAANE